jgi:hypothetical protein
MLIKLVSTHVPHPVRVVQVQVTRHVPVVRPALRLSQALLLEERMLIFPAVERRAVPTIVHITLAIAIRRESLFYEC